MSESTISSVILMRTGERASKEPDAGLLDDESKLLPAVSKGINYVQEVTRLSFSIIPFDQVLFAPSRVGQETFRAMIRCSELVAAGTDMRVEPKIHFCDLKSWAAIVGKFSIMGEPKTLADLKEIQAICWKEGILAQEDFLEREGERIFGFIVEEIAKSSPKTQAVLCIMHSPLPEAVVLSLWRKSSAELCAAKPLGSIKMLDYADGFGLGLQDGKVRRVLEERFEDKVRKKREDDRLVEQLKNLLPPRR